MNKQPAEPIDPTRFGITPRVYARRWKILGVLCLSLVLVVAAVSSVNVAIPSIRTQLRPTDTQLLWIVDIYAVVFAGLLLPAGALGDKFGRKGALLVGLATFAAASVASSFAGSPELLLVFRAVSGAGAALIMPSTLSLLTSVFPPMERPKAIAMWTGFAGAGGVIGTLVAGFLLTHFWWGSVFFVSVPIAAIALVAVASMCPNSKEAHARPLDPVGAVLSVLGFGALLYGIIEGPELGWGSVNTVAAFVVAAVALVGFVLWERRSADPMLDVRFFAIPRFGAGALAITVLFLAMFSMFFLLAQYLQSVRGYTPLRSGVATLPFAATMILLSPRGAALSARFGPRTIVRVGLVVAPLGLLLFSFAGRQTPYVYVALCLVLIASGMALCSPTLSTGIVLSLPMDKAGVGSAVNDTTRELGGAIGIAILGSIVNATYRNGLAPTLDALPEGASEVAEAARRGLGPLAAVVAQAPSIPGLAGMQPELQTLLDRAADEFVRGMQLGFRVSAGVLFVVGLVVGRWYPDGQLRPMGAPGSTAAAGH